LSGVFAKNDTKMPPRRASAVTPRRLNRGERSAVDVEFLPPMVLPVDLGFELTNLCNLHCTHCIRGSHQATIDRLDMPFIRRVLDEAVELFDTVDVVFTGGEPLASELFPSIVRELAARRLSYRFVTNGWLVPRYLPLLQDHPPRFVRVSLSGATEETHDRQRGTGSFRRALLGAAAVLSRGMVAELSLLLTRHTRSEIGEAISLAAGLRVRALHCTLMQPTPETAGSNLDLSPDEWRDVTREIHAIAPHAVVPIVLDYGGATALPRERCHTLASRQLYIDARGRVPFCCQLSRYGSGGEQILGDLRRESLAEIVARGAQRYDAFHTETRRLHQIGKLDALDEFPCMSCARRHGQTRFLAEFPNHPWAQLARAS
jgi:MoaA/NifB/PqqE/SkfB family radical SAM enzyme